MKAHPSRKKKKPKTKRPPKAKPPRVGFKPIHDGPGGDGPKGGNGGKGGSGGKGGPTFPDPWTPDVAVDLSFSTDPTALVQILEQNLGAYGFVMTDVTPDFGGLGFSLLRIGLWVDSGAGVTPAMIAARSRGLKLMDQGVTAANTMRVFLDTTRLARLLTQSVQGVVGIDLNGNVNPSGPIYVDAFSIGFPSSSVPKITTSIDLTTGVPVSLSINIEDTMGLSGGLITNSASISASPDPLTEIMAAFFGFLLGAFAAALLPGMVLRLEAQNATPGNILATMFNKISQIFFSGFKMQTTFNTVRMTTVGKQIGLQVGGGWAILAASAGTAALNGLSQAYVAAVSPVQLPFLLSIDNVQEPIANWSVTPTGGGSAPQTVGEFQFGIPTYSFSNMVSFHFVSGPGGQVLNRTVVVNIIDGTGDPTVVAATASFSVTLIAGRHGGK